VGFNQGANGNLVITQQDNNGNPIDFDTVTGDSYQVQLDLEHHLVHAGKHFTTSVIDADTDSGGSKNWAFVSPDTTTRIHLTGQLYSSSSGVLEFYENPTMTGSGNAITILNNDRNSVTSPTLAFYDDPTVTGSDIGSRLVVQTIGTKATGPFGGAGGNVNRAREFILKQGEQYLVKFVPDNDDTRLSLSLEWYEV